MMMWEWEIWEWEIMRIRYYEGEEWTRWRARGIVCSPLS